MSLKKNPQLRQTGPVVEEEEKKQPQPTPTTTNPNSSSRPLKEANEYDEVGTSTSSSKADSPSPTEQSENSKKPVPTNQEAEPRTSSSTPSSSYKKTLHSPVPTDDDGQYDYADDCAANLERERQKSAAKSLVEQKVQNPLIAKKEQTTKALPSTKGSLTHSPSKQSSNSSRKQAVGPKKSTEQRPHRPFFNRLRRNSDAKSSLKNLEQASTALYAMDNLPIDRKTASPPIVQSDEHDEIDPTSKPFLQRHHFPFVNRIMRVSDAKQLSKNQEKAASPTPLPNGTPSTVDKKVPVLDKRTTSTPPAHPDEYDEMDLLPKSLENNRQSAVIQKKRPSEVSSNCALVNPGGNMPSDKFLSADDEKRTLLPVIGGHQHDYDELESFEMSGVKNPLSNKEEQEPSDNSGALVQRLNDCW